MADPIRFHLSLNVANLDRSVEFFRTLFGTEPAKHRPDYAKFETIEPPLVLSLEPAATVSRSGALNHVGLRMPDARSLVSMQERLERSGVRTAREEGVECCYAKQTKFWLHDPDGNLWEMYTLDGDIEHRGAGQSQETVLGDVACAPTKGPAIWEHRLNEPVPELLPLADGTVDEALLRGTFNAAIGGSDREHLLTEVRRVLRPGGRVFVHVLTGEAAVAMPGLGGAAAAVQAVPQEREPMEALERAGFVGVRLLKYEAKPCFVRDGVAMREMQLEAFAPPSDEGDEVEVLYRGPLREVRDDAGRIFPRGSRVAVPSRVAAWLRSSSLGEDFTYFGRREVRLADLSCTT